MFLGTLFCVATFWPSLVPRPWAFQGVLSGVLFALGYGIGVMLIWLWNYLELPLIPGRWRGGMGLVLLSSAAAFVIYVFWNAAHWQNVTRRLMQMPEVEESYYLQISAIGFLTALVLLLLANLLLMALHWAARLPRYYVHRRIASVVGAFVFLTLLLVTANDTLVKGTISAIDAAQASIDISDPPGARPPTEAMRSGSAQSLIAWDRLGQAGKQFVHQGPRRPDIEAFTGTTAQEPIRVFVGLRSASDARQRAELALRELQRTDAFSRKLLVIATPTGTGWLQNGAIAPLEYMHDGDVATVGVQYSYLPSPQSLILQPGLAQESATVVFDVIYNYWRSLPAEERPRLYLFGLSLGSLGSETSVPLYAYVSDPFHGALWAGPTFRNPLWKRVQRNRNPDTPAWQPGFENGELFRVFGPAVTTSEEEQVQTAGWSPIRTVFLVYPSDPIVFFEENMWSREPDWMRPGRGADVSPDFTWVPLVSFFQVALDMLSATRVPPGHGHNYAVRDYTAAWVAVTAREGWTSQDTARLRLLVADEDW
ncbi:alpha/beta-hydrolase family protein [Pseudophaeobacter sp.]|uniref:alpha/beta hydrolase n=1 Tax=Pseudophaeobacter sp. TaxID=1971739 RepID=UPI003297B59B